MPSPEKIEADTCDASPAVQITRHYLAELRDACRAKQVRFLVAYVPGQAELGEDDVTSTSDLSLPEEIACRQAFDRMVRDLATRNGRSHAADGCRQAQRAFRSHDLRSRFSLESAGHTVAAEAIDGAIHWSEMRVIQALHDRYQHFRTVRSSTLSTLYSSSTVFCPRNPPRRRESYGHRRTFQRGRCLPRICLNSRYWFRPRVTRSGLALLVRGLELLVPASRYLFHPTSHVGSALA